MIDPSVLRPPVLKVCGVTTPEEARAIARLGVELVGLNFYQRSPRFLGVERALEVRRALGDRALAVGVFVGATAAQVAEIERRVGLDLLQFHGAAKGLEAFAERAIQVVPQASTDHPTGDAHDGRSWALLFDTPRSLWEHDRQYGGSGRSWDYDSVAPLLGALPGRRILVAGGISTANATEVLERLPGIFGLDVCSGVELSPGCKDLDQVAALLHAVRSHPRSEATTDTPLSRGPR